MPHPPIIISIIPSEDVSMVTLHAGHSQEIERAAGGSRNPRLRLPIRGSGGGNAEIWDVGASRGV